jgi:hypothetical protein
MPEPFGMFRLSPGNILTDPQPPGIPEHENTEISKNENTFAKQFSDQAL